ncbi:ImmA/IrrE family metallo-endopeptidase [Gemmata sp. JC673]|uniref:ImmA/IrrE family metallo-endopeptidase n=1 Tax=Gemmata algarum TaxID=2975278 RepID=A0ABU5EY59_9BACT|nr:ImmA/IrrE family metallo-endopeptidase [Gemmata algarum]MDY3558748.1 ImmA/IrrE family metallo-endopeptidase [Gemmata algarum]
MTVRPPVWVCELAARFWAEVGPPPPFPRNLRDVACWLTDLTVQEVPGLTLSRAAEHFRRAGIPCSEATHDRPLCGCFGARTCAIILIDPDDEPDQLRFTFAHELAHFLHDWREPRHRASRRFGPAILEVLDGTREPTFTERLAGALRGAPVGPLTHFLERDRWGRVTGDDAHEAEEAADRLAFELLAPFEAVSPATSDTHRSLAARLTGTFGLPPEPARKYAAALLR